MTRHCHHDQARLIYGSLSSLPIVCGAPEQDAFHVLKRQSRVEDVSVIAALSFWDYSLLLGGQLAGGSETYKATGRCFSVAAGRISYIHGLRGAI
jgi:hypothetical protein